MEVVWAGALGKSILVREFGQQEEEEELAEMNNSKRRVLRPAPRPRCVEGRGGC
jgi:hypothetical protein